MFYGRGMISLIDLYDLLFSGTDKDKIDELIKELEDDGLLLTVEEGVYGLLGVEFNTDKQSVKVTLTQGWLNNKVLIIVVMLHINKKITPAETMPLGTYSYGPPFDEP